jgi:hypothetical protein
MCEPHVRFAQRALEFPDTPNRADVFRARRRRRGCRSPSCWWRGLARCGCASGSDDDAACTGSGDARHARAAAAAAAAAATS